MVPPDRKELLKKVQAQARLLLPRLDLKDLVTKGILVKDGAWYRVLQFKLLPEYALAFISVYSPDSRGTMVKFLTVSKKSSAQLKEFIGADRKPKS
jgi:hypothetical protein